MPSRIAPPVSTRGNREQVARAGEQRPCLVARPSAGEPPDDSPSPVTRRPAFGIRWWLSATLAGVSLLTVITVALYVIPTAKDQARALAQDAALGLSARAAHDVGDAGSNAEITEALGRASRNGQFSLWLVNDRRRVVAASALPSVTLSALPNSTRAVTVALSGRRFVPASNATPTSVFSLPAQLRSGARVAIVAYAPRAGLATRTSDALRRRLMIGALLAIGLAVAVSLAIATLITKRVRRLANAAGSIASGDFGSQVRDEFPDEIGQLAHSIDEMRERLAAAFSVLEHERGGLSRVLERLDEGVIALDPSGVVEVVNPAASELLDTTIERGQYLASAWPDAPPDLHRSSPGDEVSFGIETSLGRYLQVQRVALRPGERNGGSLIVLSDRTAAHHREAVEQRFLANASHELRTPLAAILAALEMLESGAKDDTTMRDAFLSDVQQESRRLQRLTERLLTLSRIGSGSLRPLARAVDVASRLEYVADLMEPLAHGAHASLVVDGDGIAQVDPDMLDQVLVGLVGNALKHMPDGGVVQLSVNANGEALSIRVRDSGSGIPAAEIPHVFDRFWRGDAARKADGFGLGLGIAREYVESMNGTISIESSSDAGTTVAIVLPASVCAKAREEIR
jgi:two-component system sensor histidine kinase ResE